MNKFNDVSPKIRLLQILRELLENPYHYTRKKLAQHYDTSTDTIKRDMDELRNTDFNVVCDSQYRYAIAPSKSVEKLEDVLFFTEIEKNILLEALKTTNTNAHRTERIKHKLETVYDVSKLGSSLFSKSFLDKASLLEHAKRQKQTVRLINYRSTNSAEITNRSVEPFWVSTKEDMLHCFDLERQAIRHFRISRIERVETLNDLWANETRHNITATDPFRIVNNTQVRVHIKLRVGGYNELTERFPLTQAYLQPSASDAGIFDFECQVNDKFYGLTNFILGYHEHIVAIIEPDSLLAHIRGHISKINF
jgi:predicted DNA-binding transcriptional regulator YafY